MFYSTDILQRRHGRFGTIWLAATHQSVLGKREYLKVDLHRACNELIESLLVQHSRSEITRTRLPRMSLYLSAQLSYGIVKVFCKQHEYFFNDMMALSKKVGTLTRNTIINLPPRREGVVTLDDPLNLDIPLSVQFDNTFMLDEEERLRFVTDSDFVNHWQPLLSPGVVIYPEKEPVTPTPKDILRQALDSPHSVPPEKITMIEPETSVLAEPPYFGQDLPEISINDERLLGRIDRDISRHDSVSLSTDQIDIGNGSIPPPAVPDLELYKSPPQQPTEKQPKKRKSRRHLDMSLAEDVEPAPEQPQARIYGQFPIIDTLTEIPKRITSKIIGVKGTHCAPLHLISGNIINGRDAKSMLSELPKRLKFLNERLGHFHKRNYITLSAPDYFEASDESTSSSSANETASSLLVDEQVRRRESETQTPLRNSNLQQSHHESVNISRDASRRITDSSFPTQRLPSGVELPPEPEIIDHDVSMQPDIVDHTIEEIPLNVSAPTVDDTQIPIIPPLPPASTNETREESRLKMKKCVKRLILQSETQEIYFGDLCGPESTKRSTAALWFSFLLECVGVMQLQVEQRMPFGFVRISQGLEWQTLCEEVETD